MKGTRRNLFRPIGAVVGVGVNTFIGGVSGTINTDVLLAQKLGIDVSRITEFSVVGADIQCRVTGEYTLITGIATSITYFRDADNLVTALLGNLWVGNLTLKSIEFHGVKTTSGINLFGTSRVERVILPNCLTISFQFLAGNKNIVNRYNLSKCTDLGGTVLYDNVFYNISELVLPSKMYVPIALANNNEGSPDADITYNTNKGATVSYISDYTEPNAIIDLSLVEARNNSAKINFTPPTSINGLEFYEIYVNDIYYDDLDSTNIVYGLENGTNYKIEIYACDVFYNRSLSNSISVTTTNIALSFYDTNDIDALAYISASGISSTEAINSSHHLIYQLKNIGLWNKIQALYLLKGATANSHKFNAKNPVDTDAGYRLTYVGAATFSDLGYQLNGSSYADTKIIPATSGQVNKYNGLTAVCGTNNVAYSTNVYDIGAYQGGSQALIMSLKSNPTTFLKRIAVNNFLSISLNNGNESRGIYTAQRNISKTSLYTNGVKITEDNGIGILPTISPSIGALNQNGSRNGFSNQRFQIVIFHGKFSQYEIELLHSIIDISEGIALRKTW